MMFFIFLAELAVPSASVLWGVVCSQPSSVKLLCATVPATLCCAEAAMRAEAAKRFAQSAQLAN
eukprot:6490213-Lingulodinium_polyedra.AAC.1